MIKTEVINMKKYDEKTSTSRGAAVTLVFSFVAVIAIMGVYTFTRFQSNMEDQIAEDQLEFQESTLDKFQSEVTNTNDIINELPEVEVQEAEDMEEVATTEVATPNLTFTSESTMMWPMDGGVLMTYSMDQSIYFATLDQYKRNDAMIIGGEVGTEVMAGAYGCVMGIDDSVETGRTVIVDMGDGYQAVYGQLEDVKVSVGSIVEKGQIIGALAEPSRYYSVEGPNLYFQLLKDGVSVDPLEYLE